MLTRPAEFFRLARVQIFAGSLTQPQVDGTNAILAAWPKGTDIRWLAYALATAYHETQQAMEPVRENNGHPYGNPRAAYWTPDPQTGQTYYGRGYVQLTWKRNYARAEAGIPGSDLVAHPDNALKPDVAAKVMVLGMTGAWFTGLSLENFFPIARPAAADWVNARRIINGLNCAARIAVYGQHFREALDAGGYPRPRPSSD